jgi:hypothetical protein
VLICAAVFTAAIFSFTPMEFLSLAGSTLITAESITFVAIIMLVVALSQAMEAAGFFERLVKGVTGVLPSRRLRLAVLPASIGLLPMPGGAIFSAPLVSRAGEGLPLDNHLKGAINFWFRHVWEFCWPLYPGVIAYSQEIAKLNLTLRDVLPLQAILTPAMALAGFIFLFPKTLGPKADRIHEAPAHHRIAAAILPAVPILIVIACFIGLGPALHWLYVSLGGRPEATGILLERGPFIIGLVLSIAYVTAASDKGWRAVVRAVVAKPQPLSMGFMAVGIVLFGAVIGSEGVASESGRFFRETGFMLPVVVVLPFVLGLVTGITVAFVSTAFPIIVLIVGGVANPIPYLILAFASGFIGMMMSPAHLCLLVTREYFKADLLKMYRYLAWPAVGLAASAAGLFVLLRWVL